MLEEIYVNGKCSTLLNFGCGSKIKEGWFNVDAFIDKNYDYGELKDTWIMKGKVLSPHSLPNNYFTEILAEMVMEHIHPDMIPNTLYCLYHSLAPGGKLVIIVPNFFSLCYKLVDIETICASMDKYDIKYYDTIRNINNEMLDPTFEDVGFLHGHQSIWTTKLAHRWLTNEGYTGIQTFSFGPNNFYLKIIAKKPENNPYGSPEE